MSDEDIFKKLEEEVKNYFDCYFGIVSRTDTYLQFQTDNSRVQEKILFILLSLLDKEETLNYYLFQCNSYVKIEKISYFNTSHT